MIDFTKADRAIISFNITADNIHKHFDTKRTWCMIQLSNIYYSADSNGRLYIYNICNMTTSAINNLTQFITAMIDLKYKQCKNAYCSFNMNKYPLFRYEKHICPICLGHIIDILYLEPSEILLLYHNTNLSQRRELIKAGFILRYKNEVSDEFSIEFVWTK